MVSIIINIKPSLVIIWLELIKDAFYFYSSASDNFLVLLNNDLAYLR